MRAIILVYLMLGTLGILGAISVGAQDKYQLPDSWVPSGKLLPSSIPLWNQNLGPDTIVVDTAASTNTPASRMIVHRDGRVDIESGPRLSNPQASLEQHFQVSKEKIDLVFDELKKSWPFSVTRAQVMKSASFGCYQYITYDGIHSPDLETCTGDRAVDTFIADLFSLGKNP